MFGINPSSVRYNKTRLSRHTYTNPASRSLTNDSLGAIRRRRKYGVFKGRKTRIVPKYSSDSSVKFQKNPSVAIIIPPMNGPIIRVPGIVSTFVANAFAIDSRGTVFATSAILLFWLTDTHIPLMNTYAYTCAAVTSCCPTIMANRNENAAIKICIPITSFRLSSLSPSVPAIGAVTKPGSRLTPPTVTTNSVDVDDPAVRSRISHPTVSNCSHCALLEKKLPTHSSR